MNSQVATLRSYIIGFVFSILFTIDAYMIVARHALSGNWAIASIIGLAIIQLGVQLWFFLHLGSESKPRWRLLVALSALLVVLIVVVGSLWIMNNLNYRMMSSPTEMNNYINSQDGL